MTYIGKNEKFDLSNVMGHDVIALYNNGVSIQRIIDVKGLDCTYPTLKKWLMSNGVQTIKAARKIVNKTCEVCNAIYEPKSNRQRFCDKCGSSQRKKSNLVRYGITHDQFEKAFIEQDGCCHLCGKEGDESSKVNKLCVDHDHNTGEFRGLLCRGCNMAMAFVDDSEWLSRAFRYQNKEHVTPAVKVIKYKKEG